MVRAYWFEESMHGKIRIQRSYTDVDCGQVAHFNFIHISPPCIIYFDGFYFEYSRSPPPKRRSFSSCCQFLQFFYNSLLQTVQFPIVRGQASSALSCVLLLPTQLALLFQARWKDE